MASAGEKKRSRGDGRCTRCRDAHSACDQGKPCGRCARAGSAHLCIYVPRKSGRSSSSSSSDALGHPANPQPAPASSFPIPSSFHSSSAPQRPKQSPSDSSQSEAGAVVRMTEAVEQLTAQVRGLKSSYTGMQEQMAVMHASQQHTNYLVGRLLSDEQKRRQQQLVYFESASTSSDYDPQQQQQHCAWSIDDTPGSPLQRKRARVAEGIPMPSVPLNSRSTFFETERAAPSLAREWRLMEARREIPFLAQYDLPEDFAIIDFRYPIMGLLMESLSEARAPIMNYVNQAFCQFVGYSHDDLIGAPMTKCVAANNRQNFVTSEIIATKPWSVSTRYSFRPAARTRSGLHWRTYDCTYFFFDHLGTLKYALSVTCRWEEGRPKPWESFDEWKPIVARFPPPGAPPTLSSPSQPDPFATPSNDDIVDPTRLGPPSDSPPSLPPPSLPSGDAVAPCPPLHVYPSDLWPV